MRQGANWERRGGSLGTERPVADVTASPPSSHWTIQAACRAALLPHQRLAGSHHRAVDEKLEQIVAYLAGESATRPDDLDDCHVGVVGRYLFSVRPNLLLPFLAQRTGATAIEVLRCLPSGGLPSGGLPSGGLPSGAGQEGAGREGEADTTEQRRARVALLGAAGEHVAAALVADWSSLGFPSLGVPGGEAGVGSRGDDGDVGGFSSGEGDQGSGLPASVLATVLLARAVTERHWAAAAELARRFELKSDALACTLEAARCEGMDLSIADLRAVFPLIDTTRSDVG
jgi:hypothetical protein